MLNHHFYGPYNITVMKLLLRRTLVLQEQLSAFNSPAKFATGIIL